MPQLRRFYGTAVSEEATAVNLVATASLNQPVDLYEAAKVKHTIFDQEIYGGRVAYLKTPSMHGKVTIFPSGKLISVSTKSPTQAQEDLQTTADLLSEHGLIKPAKIKAEIRNIVAVFTLPEPPNLEEIAQKHHDIYEPDQFPAVIMKQKSPKATIFFFNSEKTVIAGVKNVNELKQTSDTFKRILKVSL